jgi:hypothetical protein
MLDVRYDMDSSQFVITSSRCGAVRLSYAGRVARHEVVSDTEFVVTHEDGTQSRYDEAGHRTA